MLLKWLVFPYFRFLNTTDIYTAPVIPTVTYYGRELVYGIDFTTSISKEGKTSNVTVSAKTGGDYYGSETFTGVNVQSISTWADLKTLLANSSKTRHITLETTYDINAMQCDIGTIENFKKIDNPHTWTYEFDYTLNEGIEHSETLSDTYDSQNYFYIHNNINEPLNLDISTYKSSLSVSINSSTAFLISIIISKILLPSKYLLRL